MLRTFVSTATRLLMTRGTCIFGSPWQGEGKNIKRSPFTQEKRKIVAPLMSPRFGNFGKPFRQLLSPQSKSNLRFFFTHRTQVGVLDREKVLDWSAQDVANWMQANLDLSDDQVQVVLSNNLSGVQLLLRPEKLPSLMCCARSIRELCSLYGPRSLGSVPVRKKFYSRTFSQNLVTLIPTTLRDETDKVKETSIPFVGRQAASTQAILYVNEHADIVQAATNKRKLTGLRKGNARLFAVGAPGIGKTRFGEEFPRLLAERATGHLKEKLKRVRTVRITFQNGRRLTEGVDLRWRTPKEQVDWILTSRAIYSVYDIEEEYPQWALQLAEALGDELPTNFNIPSLVEELKNQDNMTALYFHMDEVQTVTHPKLAKIGADLIRELSDAYAKFNSKKLLTLLLYSGTVLSDIESLLCSFQVGESPDFPIVALPMETLTFDQAKNIMKEMKQAGHLPWLADNWEDSASFLKLLSCTGGVPRIIELLLDVGAGESNPNNQAAALQAKVKARYSLNSASSLLDACSLAISGAKFDPTSSDKKQQLIERLRSNGYLFLWNGNVLDVPLIYLQLTNMTDEITVGPFRDHVSNIWSQALLPAGTLSWQEFKKFTLVHSLLKVLALLQLRHTTVSIGDYFSHASVPLSIQGVKFKLQQRVFIDLGSRWPGSGWPIPQKLTKSLTLDEVLHSVFLNAAGSAFDGFEFVKLAARGTPKYYVLAHQNKYTTEGQTGLTSEEILREKSKVDSAFLQWKNEDAEDPTLAKFKKATVKIILIIHTDREITGDSILPQTEVIIINNQAYFGPLHPLINYFA